MTLNEVKISQEELDEFDPGEIFAPRRVKSRVVRVSTEPFYVRLIIVVAALGFSACS